MNNDHFLNVLLIQYEPKHKDKEHNLKTLNKLLEEYNTTHKIDVVVFPEMATTGYVFDDLNDIYNLLEFYDSGPTSEFAVNLSKRLNTYVFLGYPEKEVKENKEYYYNSAMITDREGNILKSYRKSFLYETDKVKIIIIKIRPGVMKEVDL